MRRTEQNLVETANAVAVGAGRRAVELVADIRDEAERMNDHEVGAQANELWRYLIKRGAAR